jgi:hypothetical protein
VATQGSLLHGHGLARGQAAEPIRLSLRQVAARLAGGLILLETNPGEPELPVADVVARDTILATTPEGEPLIKVDGQDDLESLRDRIRWEGHDVAYHQLRVYRRDQTAQPGNVPIRLDRQAWELAVGLKDTGAIHDDVKFAREWDAGRSPWTLLKEDFRLSPDTPAPSAGPNLSRIPKAPEARASEADLLKNLP